MLPPGVNFNPTEKEMVFHYLIGKASGQTNGDGCIKDIQLYQYEAFQLSDLAYDSGHKKMYFFTLLKRKYEQGTNIDRTTPSGFWKKTGSPSFVNDNEGNQRAKKTSLTYYKKDEPPVKTEWLMKEYMLLENQLPNQNDEESKMLCLCVVYPTRRTNRGRRDTSNG